MSVLTDEEICKSVSCWIIKENCPYEDKRMCALYNCGIFSAKAQHDKDMADRQREREAIIKEIENYLRDVLDCEPNQLKIWKSLKQKILKGELK
jgi:hypothetical protein